MSPLAGYYQSVASGIAQSSGIPPALFNALIAKESSFQQTDNSGNTLTSSAGALGLGQLMPNTAASLGVDPTDPIANLTGAATYLSSLFNRYGNWRSALSAYNSGSSTGALGYADSILQASGVGSDSGRDPLTGDPLPANPFNPPIEDVPPPVVTSPDNVQPFGADIASKINNAIKGAGESIAVIVVGVLLIAFGIYALVKS